jgi:hypothetical protein
MSDKETDCIQVRVLKDQTNDRLSNFFKIKSKILVQFKTC